jgi:hypothetical protein
MAKTKSETAALTAQATSLNLRDMRGIYCAARRKVMNVALLKVPSALTRAPL